MVELIVSRDPEGRDVIAAAPLLQTGTRAIRFNPPLEMAVGSTLYFGYRGLPAGWTPPSPPPASFCRQLWRDIHVNPGTEGNGTSPTALVAFPIERKFRIDLIEQIQEDLYLDLSVLVLRYARADH